jgi:hypothetical protein
MLLFAQCSYWGGILGRNPVFRLAIHSHLYSFAFWFIFLQTHAISYSFYSSVTVHCFEPVAALWNFLRKESQLLKCSWFFLPFTMAHMSSHQVSECAACSWRRVAAEPARISPTWIYPPQSLSGTTQTDNWYPDSYCVACIRLCFIGPCQVQQRRRSRAQIQHEGGSMQGLLF